MASADYEMMPANDLRVGHYAIMKGKTCKVLEITRAKTGKHGGAKLHLIGLDIFSHKKVEDIIGSTKTLDVPEVPDVDDQKKISQHLQSGHMLVATLTSARGMETYDSFKRKYK